MQKLSRPLGVSIIANFSIILGIIGLFAVIAVSVGGVNTANTVANSRVNTAASSGARGRRLWIEERKSMGMDYVYNRDFDRICHYQLRYLFHCTTRHRRN